MQGLAYLVGGLTADVRRAACASARATKAPEPDHAETLAVVQPEEQGSHGRRQRAKATQFGRRYEYPDAEPAPSATASASGAEALGFAGTAPVRSATTPAGLTALTDDAFGGSTRAPMLPSTWEAEP